MQVLRGTQIVHVEAKIGIECINEKLYWSFMIVCPQMRAHYFYFDNSEAIEYWLEVIRQF